MKIENWLFGSLTCTRYTKKITRSFALSILAAICVMHLLAVNDLARDAVEFLVGWHWQAKIKITDAGTK